MKRINYLLSLVALGAVVTSCQEDSSELLGKEVNGDAVNVTIAAEIKKDELGSKSSIDDLAFSWIATDDLSVYNGGSSNVEFTQTEVAVGATGVFNGTLTETDPTVVYAVYPYNESYVFTEMDGTVTFIATQPENQNQKHSEVGALDLTSIGVYSYMAGRTVDAVTVSTEPLAMKMSQFMTLVDFNISEIPTTTKVTSLVLRSDVAFATTANVGFSSDGTPPMVTATGTNTCKSIEVKLNDGMGIVVGDNGLLTVRLAMLPQTTAANSNWYVDLVTEGNVVYTFRKDFSSEMNYSAGGRYPADYDFNYFTKSSLDAPVFTEFTAEEGKNWSLYSGSNVPPIFNGDVTFNAHLDQNQNRSLYSFRRTPKAIGSFKFNIKSMDETADLYLVFVLKHANGNQNFELDINGDTGMTMWKVANAPTGQRPVNFSFDRTQPIQLELRLESVNGLVKASYWFDGVKKYEFPDALITSLNLSDQSEIKNIYLGATKGIIVLDSWMHTPLDAPTTAQHDIYQFVDANSVPDNTWTKSGNAGYQHPTYADGDMTLRGKDDTYLSGCRVYRGNKSFGRYTFNVKSMSDDANINIWFEIPVPGGGYKGYQWYLNAANKTATVYVRPSNFLTSAHAIAFNPNQPNKIEIYIDNSNGLIKPSWYLNGKLVYQFTDAQVIAHALNFTGSLGYIYLTTVNGTVVLDSWEFKPAREF